MLKHFIEIQLKSYFNNWPRMVRISVPCSILKRRSKFMTFQFLANCEMLPLGLWHAPLAVDVVVLVVVAAVHLPSGKRKLVQNWCPLSKLHHKRYGALGCKFLSVQSSPSLSALGLGNSTLTHTHILAATLSISLTLSVQNFAWFVRISSHWNVDKSPITGYSQRVG